MKNSIFSRETTAIFWNLNITAIQRMLDYDYLIDRKPSIVAIVVPTGNRKFEKFMYGQDEFIIPIFRSTKSAASAFPNASLLINFASFRTAYQVALETIDIPSIKLINITAEGIPERHSRYLAHRLKDKGKITIGPATVGGIVAGALRIGNAGGTIENILSAKLYRSGNAGLVTRSGGLFNELSNMMAKNADGIVQGVAIGGDRYPGSTFLDHLLRYEEDDRIKFSVMIGEIGGNYEYQVVDALKKGLIKKPLVAWCIGTVSKYFADEVQFGHAGAKADMDRETSDAKNRALKEVGAIVPDSFYNLPNIIRSVYEKLKSEGKIKPIVEPHINKMPLDCQTAEALGKIRMPTNFICTISDDRGKEICYNGVTITDVISNHYSIADVISILWLKRRFPAWASNFIDLIIKIVADHGPAVSGAITSKITARAGKDIVSSLVAGLLTIGPRFGGAIDGAARHFKKGSEKNIAPSDFVEYVKNIEKIHIPGIGHRIKSVRNPDIRVSLLKDYARKNFPLTKTLEYALEIEKITTGKKENLILNVDGTIGVLFVDLLAGTGYKSYEIDEIIDNGTLNAFFVLARSIGFIGHILDEKRLGLPLYRHPRRDILYDAGCDT